MDRIADRGSIPRSSTNLGVRRVLYGEEVAVYDVDGNHRLILHTTCVVLTLNQVRTV